MALRKHSGTQNSSANSFYLDYYIEMVSKASFKDIEGFCIWQYRITSPTGFGRPVSTEGVVDVLTGKVGLVFSARIDIKKPELYPQCATIQDTFVALAAGTDRQYVYKDFHHGTTTSVQIDLFFIAPCEEDSYTPIRLVTALSEGGIWVTLPFRVDDRASDPCTTQVVRGPAVITPVCDVPSPPEPSPSPQPGPPPQPTPGPQPPASPQPAPAPCPPNPVPICKPPLSSFTGTLPYASEIFGIYQPLAGWLGARNNRRFAAFQGQKATIALGNVWASSATAGISTNASSPVGFVDSSQGILSPVGLVTLFREYFFEFDTFLGAPAGHIWISPGGTVEVVESSTRRTLVERTAAQSEDSTTKVEESLTSQDDVADAVKEDNANDTKLGASASAGAKFAGIYHADASASFSNEQTTKKSSEETHKHTRTQSSKVSSEIHRNFKTTFKTVTETTDVTSRRYVVQNTTDKLVNYELRRKMRKVGVQVQHIGTRLSWQVFLNTPGKELGLGELMHVVPAPDLSSLKKPEPPPPLQPKDVEFTAPFTLRKYPGTSNDPHQEVNYTASPGSTPVEMNSDNNDDHIVGEYEFTAPAPSPGYTIGAIRQVSAKTQSGDAQFLASYDWIAGSTGLFKVTAQFLNFGGGRIITLTVAVTWNPPTVDPAQAEYQILLNEYNIEAAELQRKAYGEAVKDRINLISGLRRRAAEDLRKEERQTVYGKLIHALELFSDPHLGSELIRQIFDVDEMLYFAAPDYWRPSIGVPPDISGNSVGKYPVPPVPPLTPPSPGPSDPLDAETIGAWYSHTAQNNALDPMRSVTPEWRINYLVTETSQPAPLGSSLGWLIQIDGDERRNEFLNAAWVKAVLPIRPGHELEALDWLAQATVEGEEGLVDPYPVQPGDPSGYAGKTVGNVLQLLASELQTSNTDITNTLATEKVFETGFDPLGSGFRPAEPYQIFDEWVEVLPTDQVVAVEVQYDPKTGQLL